MSPLQSAQLSSIRGVAHGFFGRWGGVSQGIYASLNCGYGSGDDPEAVRENRTRATSMLGASERCLLTAYQVHSAEAVIVSSPWTRGGAPKADAMATTAKGLALGVLAADCAPVLLVDEKGEVIGTAHAGWKGALTGVIEAAVEAMESLGAGRARIRAAVGPCIGRAAYEVGPEFYARFVDRTEANGRYFTAASRKGHWQFDLQGFVAARLAAIGVGGVDLFDTCTYEEDYFSYRRAIHRGEPDYGRNLSTIMLQP